MYMLLREDPQGRKNKVKTRRKKPKNLKAHLRFSLPFGNTTCDFSLFSGKHNCAFRESTYVVLLPFREAQDVLSHGKQRLCFSWKHNYSSHRNTSYTFLLFEEAQLCFSRDNIASGENHFPPTPMEN